MHPLPVDHDGVFGVGWPKPAQPEPGIVGVVVHPDRGLHHQHSDVHCCRRAEEEANVVAWHGIGPGFGRRHGEGGSQEGGGDGTQAGATAQECPSPRVRQVKGLEQVEAHFLSAGQGAERGPKILEPQGFDDVRHLHAVVLLVDVGQNSGCPHQHLIELRGPHDVVVDVLAVGHGWAVRLHLGAFVLVGVDDPPVADRIGVDVGERLGGGQGGAWSTLVLPYALVPALMGRRAGLMLVDHVWFTFIGALNPTMVTLRAFGAHGAVQFLTLVEAVGAAFRG